MATSIFVSMRFDVHGREACTVSELLDTRLADAGKTGVNSALLPSSTGYMKWMFRDTRLYGSNMTQRDRHTAIARAISCAQAMLRNASVDQWWINGGALVGAYRHSAQLPHDTDGDLMIPTAEFDRLVAHMRKLRRFDAPPYLPLNERRNWNRLAPRLAHFSDGRCAMLRRTTNNSTLVAEIVDVGTGFYVDVWVGDFVNEIYRWFEFGSWHELPKSAVLPLRQVSLHPLTVPAPQSIESYLNAAYGGGFGHPDSVDSLLALYVLVGAPVLWLTRALVVVLSCASLMPRRRVHRSGPPVGERVGQLLMLNGALALIAVSMTNCRGSFALGGAWFALSMLVRHRRLAKERKHVLFFALSLLCLCALALRFWLARWLLGGELFGKLPQAFLAVDYRTIWNGIEQ